MHKQPELSTFGFLSGKISWDWQGKFATSPNDKPLPIPLHEIWPGVSAPFCVGPWTKSQGRRTMDRPPYHKAPRLGPRAFSIRVVDSFGGNFVWPYISTHAPIYQYKPCRCYRWVVLIIERIDSGCASNVLGVLIRLTARFRPMR